VALISLFAFVLTASCGGEPSDGARQEADGELPVAEIDTRWAIGEASDIATLLRERRWVFVGAVTSLREQLEADLVPGDDGPQATVPGKPLPAQSGPPPIPVSIFDVRVEDVIAGELSPGEMVTVRQTGGMHVQSTGETIRVILEGDEPLEPGRSYLFFVSPNEFGNFVTSPIARMTVEDDGSFAALAEFADLGAMRQLASLARVQAEQAIAEAAAE
jgi:hypothetical protein